MQLSDCKNVQDMIFPTIPKKNGGALEIIEQVALSQAVCTRFQALPGKSIYSRQTDRQIKRLLSIQV